MKALKLSVLLLFSAAVGFSQPAGRTTLPPDYRWTEFIAGNMPLVISVPHGGAVYLPGAGLRKCGEAVTRSDIHTVETAKEIRAAFGSLYHAYPYLVICRLSRRNIDQNRDIETGTCGNALMKQNWLTFHNCIDSALAEAVKEFGFALYTDLHGHSHPVHRVELGYLLTGPELPGAGKTGSHDTHTGKSSLNNLILLLQDRKGREVSATQLITGETAFGSLLYENGIAVFPAKQTPRLRKGESYYSGGYNTQRYTSARYPAVFGWQTELNYFGVRDKPSRSRFAKAFARSVMEFFEQNIPFSAPSQSPEISQEEQVIPAEESISPAEEVRPEKAKRLPSES